MRKTVRLNLSQSLSKTDIMLSALLHLLVIGLIVAVYFYAPTQQKEVFSAEIWAEIPVVGEHTPTTPIEPEPKSKPDSKIVEPPEPKIAPEPKITHEPDNAEIVLAQKQKEQQKLIEQKRLQEEQERKLAEQKRLKKEQERKLAEQKHLKEEQERKLAEQKRLKEEQEHKLAENKRRQEEQRQKQQNEKNNQEFIARLQQAAGPFNGISNSNQASNVSPGYGAKVSSLLKNNTIFPKDITGNPNVTLRINLAPDGTILSREVLQSSGNKAWDDASLRAVDKTAKLPDDQGKPPPTAIIIHHKPY